MLGNKRDQNLEPEFENEVQKDRTHSINTYKQRYFNNSTIQRIKRFQKNYLKHLNH